MIQSIILGLVQGLTEFLPISSSGHLIIARDLLHIPIANSLAFDVFLNTATLFAVLYCFWGDIRRILVDFYTEGLSNRSSKLVWGIIIATIPAVIVGAKYGDTIENSFRSSSFVAWMLIAGAALMFIADKAPYKGGSFGPVRSLVVGLFQCLAFFPGMSRSGSTISGGLIMGLSREEAIRFSFLLYIPISIGAALKAFLDLALNGSGSGIHELFTLSSVLAFIFALASGIWAVKFMVRYLSKHSFAPFIIYRVVLAAVVFLFLQ